MDSEDRSGDGPRESFLHRLIGQLVAVNVFDSATRQAAQAFLSAIPVLFVVGAFAPQSVRDTLMDSLRSVMGLNTSSEDQVLAVLRASGDETQEAFGAVGILVVLLSATAFSRALQRACERSWHLRPAGVRLVAWRWLVWLCVMLTTLIVQGAVRDGLGVGPALGVPLSLLVSMLMWWWTQHLLLGGRIGWLPLLPGAVLTGIGAMAVTWGSRLFMPRMLERSVTQFGPLGAVFTMLSWLIVFFACVTVCIALGQVLAHEPPLRRRLHTDDADG